MLLTINNKSCRDIDDVRASASQAFADFLEEFLNENDYVVAHTSGSTGEPKEIRLLKADMRSSARLTNFFFGINKDSLLYLPLSPTYIAGKMMIVRAIESGAAICEEKPTNEPLADYSGAKIDLAAFVPSQLGFLINNPGLLENVRSMIIGGGQLSPRVEHWLADKGVDAYKTYGMTETCSHIALSKVASGEPNPFTAIGDVSFELDCRGCLVINVPQFSMKQIVTNDMVDLIDDRNFYWKGRFDNVINSGGIKIFPEEVEKKLSKLISHSRYFITSRPSDKWGEETVLALEYKNLPVGKILEGEIKPSFVEQMKSILPSYAVPRHYVAVNKFKETTSGKIIRKIDF
mgnify:CR=1 FL=1